MYLLVILALVASMTAQAQFTVTPQQTQDSNGRIPIVDGRIFPLGAVIAGDAAYEELHKMFLNVYSGFHWQSGDAPHGTFGDSLLGIQGGSMLKMYAYFNEQRNYLFSGYQGDSDRIYDYAVNPKFQAYDSAFIHRVAGSRLTDEYRIDTATAPLDEIDSESNPSFGGGYQGNYLLRDPVYDLYTKPNSLYNPPFNEADTFFFEHYGDFIYRFNTTDLASIDSDAVLYNVEVWIKGAKSSTSYSTGDNWLRYDTILPFSITRRIFENARANDTVWKTTNDLEHNLRTAPIGNLYVRLHMVLDSTMMRHYFKDDSVGFMSSRYRSGDSLGGDDSAIHRNLVRFDVRLRRNPNLKVPIFVKGIRMRNGGAERLLTGQFDALLANQFDSIKNSWYRKQNGQRDSGNYYNNLININIEAEPYPDRYYIMGYLDRFARDNGYKRITSFSPYYPKEVRLVWDDILWRSDRPDTMAPEHLWRNIDYTNIYNSRNYLTPWDLSYKPYAMTPLPIDVLPKSVIRYDDSLDRFIVRDSFCNMFTQRIVDRTDSAMHRYELEHDSIFRYSYRRLLREVNEAAFGIGTKPIPFWIMAQAYVGFYTVETPDTSYTHFTLNDGFNRPPLLPEINRRAYLIHIIDSIQHLPGATDSNIVYMLHSAEKLYDTTKMGFDRGNVSAESIRLQGNMAAAWGARGFHVSNIGNDGTTDIGFNTLNFSYDDATPRFRYEHDAEVPTPGVAFLGEWMELGTDSLSLFTIRNDTTQEEIDTANGSLTLPSPWRYVMCDTNKRMIYPRSPGGPLFYHSCNHGLTVWSELSTFYGFQTRFRGTKWAFGDLNNAADQLAKMKWIAAWDVSERDTTIPQAYRDTLPIMDISTVLQKKKRMSSETDDSYQDSTAGGADTTVYETTTNRFVEVGVFRDAKDTSARFIYVVNRRVWPNRPSDDSLTNDDYLGNVAVRRIRFKVKPEIFNADTNFILWQITDWATKKDSVIHRDSLYGHIFEPGEGRLFRVAPAIGLQLGRMDNNLLNNGRHICAVENDTLESNAAITHYLATYTRDSMVVVSYVVETEGNARRTTSTPVDSIIDFSRKNFNPAIAYNFKKNSIGVVYQNITKDTNASSLVDTIRILYRRASFSTPYTFTSAKQIDKFTVNRPYTAPPAIAPRNAVGVPDEFWISYNHPDSGAKLTIVTANGGEPFAKKSYFKSQQAHVELVSIATHTPYDTLRIAFQEGNNNERHIFYADGFINGNPAIDVTPSGSIRLISNILYGCGGQEIHPQIAVDADRYIGVIWEAQGTRCLYPSNPSDCYPKLKWQNVITRHRDINNVWGEFTQFRIQSDTVKDSTENDAYEFFYAYPNIAVKKESAALVYPSPLWSDFERLMWNHPKDGAINIWRYGLGQQDRAWKNKYLMMEPSLEPAMPTHSVTHLMNTPILYRHPYATPNNAWITRYDFPNTGVTQRMIDVLMIKPFSDMDCIHGPTAKLARIMIHNGDQMSVGILPFRDSLGDMKSNLSWDDSRARSEGFSFAYGDTLRYQRYFYVGNYEAGDTATAASNLTDTNDHITLRVYLRSSSNDSVLAVLDTARLFQTGFTQTAGMLGGGWRIYPAPFGLSDSVYLTMEASRGDTANGFEIAHYEAYDDDIFDTIPPTLPLFKRAENQNPHPTAQGHKHTPLLVTVNPNPFTGSTTVSVETIKGLPFVVEVYDLLGKRMGTIYSGVSQADQCSFTLYREMLRPGAYFVRVQAGNDVVTKKIQLVQ